jgi:hypothetical protein
MSLAGVADRADLKVSARFVFAPAFAQKHPTTANFPDAFNCSLRPWPDQIVVRQLAPNRAAPLRQRYARLQHRNARKKGSKQWPRTQWDFAGCSAQSNSRRSSTSSADHSCNNLPSAPEASAFSPGPMRAGAAIRSLVSRPENANRQVDELPHDSRLALPRSVRRRVSAKQDSPVLSVVRFP